MELEPDNKQNQNQYSRTLAWLADAQLGVCDLDGAWRSRVTGTALARAMSEEAPGNRAHKLELAYALTGAAMVQRYRGEPDVALDQLEEAQALLDELIALDPSNIKLKWESTRRAALIAALHSDLGRQATALPAMAAIRDEFDGLLSHNEDEYLRRTSEFGQFLLDYSQVARRDGDPDRAAQLLDAAVEMLSAALSGNTQDRANTNAMKMAEFRRWELHGATPAEMTGQDSQGEAEADFEAIGCLEANLSAHGAILRGNRALAEGYTTYLLESGYRDPGFVMFCKDYELCDL
jgi:tetratricopeptide (TPR) repeat protein